MVVNPENSLYPSLWPGLHPWTIHSQHPYHCVGAWIQLMWWWTRTLISNHLIRFLILLAFITRNSSLEPLLEGLFAQIHIDLSWRVFGRNRTWDLRITQFCSVPRSSPPSYGDGCITEDPSGPTQAPACQICLFVCLFHSMNRLFVCEAATPLTLPGLRSWEHIRVVRSTGLTINCPAPRRMIEWYPCKWHVEFFLSWLNFTYGWIEAFFAHTWVLL